MTETLNVSLGIAWRDVKFRLQYRQELSRDRSGRTQGRDLGPAIWFAEFRTQALPPRTSSAAMAKMRSLEGVRTRFYAYELHSCRPVASAPGDLDGYAPTLASINANPRFVTLAGLPVGLTLSTGDYLSIETSADGRDLHQVVSGSAADGAGTTGLFEVTPPLRPQAQVGQDVILENPPAEMVLLPGTLDDPLVDARNRAITFSAAQVLR